MALTETAKGVDPVLSLEARRRRTGGLDQGRQGAELVDDDGQSAERIVVRGFDHLAGAIGKGHDFVEPVLFPRCASIHFSRGAATRTIFLILVPFRVKVVV